VLSKVGEPAAAKVRLSVQTAPPGAEVFRFADGVRLGITPWQSLHPTDEGTLPLLLRRPGYADRRVDLELSHDDDRQEMLVALALAPLSTEPPTGPPPVQRHKRKHRHRNKAVSP
jgi:hypothetical protein